MSQDSSSKLTVQDIFNKMEYGPVPVGKTLAETWLKENAENLGIFMNGKLTKVQQSNSVKQIPTGVIGTVNIPQGNQEIFNAAMSASTVSFPSWAALSSHTRASILYSVARQIQKHVALLCELEALSKCVQVGNAQDIDVPALVRIFYYYAGWAQLLESEMPDWKYRSLGPMIGVSSSSAPLVSLGMFIAPALAAGNTITLLPDISNCLSALLLAQICTASGVPPGVINVVPQCHTFLEEIFSTGDVEVNKIAVIGSPTLGRSIYQKSGKCSQNTMMMLNGCVPMIVLDSADLDAAVDCIADAACINQGQDPWALRLIIVQESVYTLLKSKLSSRIISLKTGATFDKMADVSDVVIDSSIASQLQEILISDPSSEVVQPAGSGNAKWAPTVIFSATPPSEPVLQVSTGCPVIHVVRARSAKEAVSIANHCGGGVAASVWTESSAFSWECSVQLKASTVWINNFGVLDASVPICGRNSTGYGCFLGKEGLLEQLQPVDFPVLTSSKNKPRNMTRLLPVPVDEPTIDKTFKLFYGGGHKRPNSNIHKTVIDGNGKNIAIVPESNRKDVRNAVEAAVKAQPGWWKRGSHNRAQIIFNLAEKLQARRNHFESCLRTLYHNLDQIQCQQEVDECVKLLFHFGAICDKVVQSASHSVGDIAVAVMREPLGVVASVCSTGAGGALASVIALIGATIAYGNTCVIVTDLEWALPSLELALVLEAAEVPAGVVNILTGITSSLLPTVSGHMDVNAVWCAGIDQKRVLSLTEESSKSNMKQVWIMNNVVDPCQRRQIFEMRASQSKAIWLSSLASFGS